MAAGVARRFGWDPTIVRIVFVIGGIGGGTGVIAYFVGWLALRRDDEQRSILHQSAHDAGTIGLAIGIGTLLVAALSAFTAAGLSFAAGLVWPVGLAGGGLVVVWRDGDEDERAAIRRIISHFPGLDQMGVRTRRAAIIRAVLALGVASVGIGAIVVGGRSLGSVGKGVVAAITIVAGFIVIFGSFWLRLGLELADERRERVRSQERAEMAAHVHDSVLQTLALIQKRADDPRQVVALARAQERELRQWLFEDRKPAAADPDLHLAAALIAVETEVEAAHGVAVESVTVGDCELDEDLAALVDAGREAAVNAAKWSGAAAVSLFAEVEMGQVSLFIRDRGAGFDLDRVASDRRGITESIRGRMARHGGTATIRTAPGEGTEVALRMPRRRSGTL
ncbi:MAG: PspC domain-containing protein [Actinomycetota bacterium]|nr:PspC domain-containing protein [Actinomycetota bacterium]